MPGKVEASRHADFIPLLKCFYSTDQFYLNLDLYIKWLDSMSANVELKYASFIIIYAMMRKKSAGENLSVT